MSQNPADLIPWDKLGKNTTNFIAVLVCFVILAAPIYTFYTTGKMSEAATRAEDARIAAAKYATEIQTELRIERDRRGELERELSDVRENMALILADKDREIAELKGQIKDLQDHFDSELLKWRAREAELVERIAALKLQDGKSNSFN